MFGRNRNKPDKLTLRGAEAGRRGDYFRAIALFRKALVLYQRIDGTEEEQADCFQALAFTLDFLGENAEAESLYRQALTLYENIDNADEDRADCLQGFAFSLHLLGRGAEAEPLYRQALSLYENIDGTAENQADCLTGLSITLFHLDRMDEAETLNRQALHMYQSIEGSREGQADALHNLARILHALDREEEAEPFYRQALHMYKCINRTEIEQAHSLLGLGETLHELGRQDEAENALETAFNILKTSDDGMEDVIKTELQAMVLLAKARVTTDPALLTDIVSKALDYALPAALVYDELRYQLAARDKRYAWTHNRAEYVMASAINFIDAFNNAPLLAELVAKWRTVGALTTTTTASSSTTPEDLTRAPGPALIMPHPRTTPLYTHPLLRKRPRIRYR